MGERDFTTVVSGQFGGNPYKDLQALQDDILRVIHQRDGTVPLAGVIGVLRLIEQALLEELG